METGFSKADSQNLPNVDVDMVRSYFLENADFSSVEIKGKKLIRSTRESYGDNAVGFVQIKREAEICIVKGRVTPEHKVRDKGYAVEVQVNESQDLISLCKCHDCAAAEGGCKHAVAFLLWLHRRSEEPAVTSVTCYWKKPRMALTSSSEVIKAKNMGKSQSVGSSYDEVNLLTKFLATVSKTDCNASVQRYFVNNQEPLSIHKICTSIKLSTAKNFLEILASEMTEQNIQAVFNATKEQSEAPVWYELRYGRITGSILYEAAQCQTTEGSLMHKIMGQQTAFTSEAIVRGKTLEKKVMETVKLKENIRVRESGLILSRDFPVLGATPDGISDDYVIEIKCPATEKSFKTYYVKDGVLTKKCWSQIQSQMYMAKKKIGLFCVAHPDFESSNNVDVYKVLFDPKIVLVLEKATLYWCNSVFPKLKQNYA